MLSEAFKEQNTDPGTHFRYRIDGGLFSSRCLQAITKVKETVIRDVLFADDCALCVSSKQSMQSALDSFSTACDCFGLTISTEKTEVMFNMALEGSTKSLGI